MPSKNMLPKGKRRQSVKSEYREQRTLAQEREAAARASGVVEEVEVEAPVETETVVTEAQLAGFGFVTSGPGSSRHPKLDNEQTKPRYGARKVYVEPAPEIQVHEDLEAEDGVRTLVAEAAAAGMRLDAYLAKALPDISRARVVLLIEAGQVTVDGQLGKGKQKLKGGETVEIEGEPNPAPLNAEAEDIPLNVVYEDDDLAVIDKPAGMMVHAGSGAAEHNRGTLVNALLHHLGKNLSAVGGGLRPGIVHRLDKQTSGLIVVAKNDGAHRKLGEMFAERSVHKMYIALVHGWLKEDSGTVNLPISRDLVRRIRMTTRRSGGRSAVTHWKVLERIDGAHGKFTLLEVRIETGRTHQIRVHMQALGHPVVGDFLYGAPHRIKRVGVAHVEEEELTLERNFLHAAELEFAHPRTGKLLELQAPIPAELAAMLQQLR
jgi:23S rRNA pseudouridine1911/1915/1917 synthase